MTEQRQLITDIYSVEKIEYLRGYFEEHRRDIYLKGVPSERQYATAWAVLELGHLFTAEETLGLTWGQWKINKIEVRNVQPRWDIRAQNFKPSYETHDVPITMFAENALKIMRHNDRRGMLLDDTSIFYDKDSLRQAVRLLDELWEKRQEYQYTTRADREANTILEMHRMGKTDQEIAVIIGCRPEDVRHVLDYSQNQIQYETKVCLMYDAGHTQDYITRTLKLPHAKVHTILMQYKEKKDHKRLKEEARKLWGQGYTPPEIMARLRIDHAKYAALFNEIFAEMKAEKAKDEDIRLRINVISMWQGGYRDPLVIAGKLHADLDKVEAILKDIRRWTRAETTKETGTERMLKEAVREYFRGGSSDGGKTKAAQEVRFGPDGKKYTIGVDPGAEDPIIRVYKDGREVKVEDVDLTRGTVTWKKDGEGTALTLEALKKLRDELHRKVYGDFKFYHENTPPPETWNEVKGYPDDK